MKYMKISSMILGRGQLVLIIVGCLACRLWRNSVGCLSLLKKDPSCWSSQPYMGGKDVLFNNLKETVLLLS